MALSTVTPSASTVDRQNRSYQLAMLAARTAADNNGKDIVVLDMREQTPIFDYFVIATGTSRRQLHAISDEIESVLLRGAERAREHSGALLKQVREAVGISPIR